MAVIAVLVVTLQILTGLGILALCRFHFMRSAIIPLAFLLGSFVHSVAFFTIDVFSLGFSQLTMLSTAFLCAIASHSRLSRVSEFYNYLVRKPGFTLRMYDVVALVIGCGLGYYIVWAAWYWPVTPFDAMAGIDLVARQAVEEGTIDNRVFTDASLVHNLSNQPFYAPYAMLMQVMYRLMGFMFGQLWVSFVAVMFSWFMWSALRQVCHPFIANILWILFLLTPELLGYTYLLQTDYVNAAFFVIGVVLFVNGLLNKTKAYFIVSAIAFSAACWSRSETIAIVIAGVFVFLPYLWKQLGASRALKYSGTIIGVSLLSFLLWSAYYVPFRLPVQPDIIWEVSVAKHFTDVISETFQRVLLNTNLWGWAFPLFVILTVLSLIVKKEFGPIAILTWMFVTLLCLVLIAAVFQSAIVELTVRRGIFKIIPLVFIAVGSLPLIKTWTNKLQQWEMAA